MRQGDIVEIISGPYAGQRATIKIADSNQDGLVIVTVGDKEIPVTRDNFRRPVGSRLNIPYSAGLRQPKS